MLILHGVHGWKEAREKGKIVLEIILQTGGRPVVGMK
jgi:hypothetical protein